MALVIKPDWQPAHTAPKDGSVVRFAIQTMDVDTGEPHVYYKDLFWGKMTRYPEKDPMWVDANCPENGFYTEETFVHEILIWDRPGCKTKIPQHWGTRIIGWTRPWTVEVAFPEIPLPRFINRVTVHKDPSFRKSVNPR